MGSEKVTSSWTRNWQFFHSHSQLGGLDSGVPSHPVQCFVLHLIFWIGQNGRNPQKPKPTHKLCLYPIKGYQIHKNYICTSARNICGAGGGRLGENKEKYDMHLLCSFALLLWSSHTIRGRIRGWTGPSFHLLQLFSCLEVMGLQAFKKSRKKWLVAEVPCGFCFHLQKTDKIQDVQKK